MEGEPIKKSPNEEWSAVRGDGALEDPESWRDWERVKKAVVERFEDLATDPALGTATIPSDSGERVQRNEKVERSILAWDAIAGIGHDLRLSHDEIDVLRKKIFEPQE